MSYEKRIATLGVSEQEKPFIRRGKRSSKPIEGRDGFDTKCKFRFSVYWDQDSMRWYVPKEQQGCLQHAGHMREDPLNIRLNSKFLGTKEQRQNIVDAVDSEVRPASAALFEANFDCRTFGKCTTGINEAEHRVIKYSDLGPRPCDDIGSTHRKLYDLHKTRTVANSKKAAHLANTQLTNDAEHFFSAEDITPYCNERLRKNLNDSLNYHAYRVDDSTFFVKRDM
ncbi:hypothetical protein THAOC_23617 [Thalassiosira oceanica]|uniref:Uncharacterized protein n=1 Tax=Thalassiosira oceanica TaxID=159749 RepID=K0RVL0_THAOC|nr:hypothetical protein THAOC_23617 [Thalassiosira oceanica]|eukprot:EJK56484.1 hypothetical protein THAOC_23617 [Thalassiosira oceanica]